ncbi:hypothetical protein CDL15_Pgr024123 [Punica granatum]|uniref:Uncharacterized protein n=1 Tax=Punica granatum TaxID=22663 RepID=A0A218XW46_PUNGR|nr:hypothetical protein CDL15_Pgr024123 [Punica granatum]PKI61918.1 hypothetical protein CRG98_017644 [Punica granatum]
MNGEGEVGQRRGIWRPRTAAFTSGRRGDGAGDGDEHRLDYAVLRMGVIRLGSFGIEGDFGFFGEVSSFFGEVSSFSGEGFLSSITGNRGNWEEGIGGLCSGECRKSVFSEESERNREISRVRGGS